MRSRETVEQALAAALEQIADRRYDEELVACGAAPILTYGIVFNGKQVWMRRGGGGGAAGGAGWRRVEGLK